MANSLFALAIGSAAMLQKAGAPENIMLLVLVSVVISAAIANLMLIKSTGLIGIGGLSLAYTEVAGHTPASVLLIFITALTIAAIALMIFADFSIPSNRSHSDEISEP